MGFQVQQMVLTLLEDAQLEVRVQAAKVVSGLLHCHFIPEPTALLVCRVIYFVFFTGTLVTGQLVSDLC